MILIGFSLGILTNLMPLRAEEESKHNKLPDITLENVNGESFNLTKVNELTLLFFWLPQSDSCLIQLSRLQEFINNNDINILAIAIGDIKQNELLEVKTQLKLEFPLLIDRKAKLSQKFKLATIPTTFIYDPQANDLDTIIGTYKTTKIDKKLNN